MAKTSGMTLEKALKIIDFDYEHTFDQDYWFQYDFVENFLLTTNIRWTAKEDKRHLWWSYKHTKYHMKSWGGGVNKKATKEIAALKFMFRKNSPFRAWLKLQQ